MLRQPRTYIYKDVLYLHDYDSKGIPFKAITLPRNIRNFEEIECNDFIMFCDILEYNEDRENFKVRVFLEDGEIAEGWTPQGYPSIGISDQNSLLASGALNSEKGIKQ